MKTHLLFILLLISSFFNASIAKEVNYLSDYTETGTASFYGKKFHGRLTANGEKFNMHALTAAHKSLPFNSLVKVTDMHTGKEIIVRINDRGPFIKGRMIDLSKGAARELGMLKKGIANVEVKLIRLGTGDEEESEAVEIPVKKEEKKVKTKSKESTGKTYSIWGKEKVAKGFGIQIGSYISKKQMLSESKKAYGKDLKELYVQKIMLNGKLHYRLLFLAKDDKETLQRALKRVKKMGYRGAFIRKHL